MKFSKFIVSMVILLNVVFTAAIIYIFSLIGDEPTTLIAAWFSFTTIELWSLSSITKQKEKSKIETNKNRPTI